MNEVSNTEATRSLVTSASRKDAAAASHTASQGQSSGNVLPQQQVESEQVRVKEAREQSAERTQQRVERAVESLNDYAKSFQRDLEFSVDDELGRPIVHVVDRNTQEVIRQIPSDVTLRLARNLQSLQSVQSAQSDIGADGAHRLGLVNTRV